MSYKIEDHDPNALAGVDMARVMETMRALKVGKRNSFLIPAAELPESDSGRWSTTAVGQKINHAARRLGIKVRTKKETGEAPGLRVTRIE